MIAAQKSSRKTSGTLLLTVIMLVIITIQELRPALSVKTLTDVTRIISLGK